MTEDPKEQEARERLIVTTARTADRAALYQLIGIIVGALQVLGVAWIAYKTAQLEKNTNHIMDQLVTKTRMESHAEGVQDEKDRAK